VGKSSLLSRKWKGFGSPEYAGFGFFVLGTTKAPKSFVRTHQQTMRKIKLNWANVTNFKSL